MKPKNGKMILPKTLDLVSCVFVWACAILIFMAAGMLIFSTLSAGIGQVNFDFITQEPEDSGRAGGIAPILYSTTLIVGVCLIATIPLGLGTSIYLAEFLPTVLGWGVGFDFLWMSWLVYRRSYLVSLVTCFSVLPWEWATRFFQGG